MRNLLIFLMFIVVLSSGAAYPPTSPPRDHSSVYEGLGLIELDATGMEAETLICINRRNDGCTKSSVSVPNEGDGVVCRCSAAPHQYCCQLVLLDSGSLLPVGNCSKQQLVCDGGDTCSAHLPYVDPEDPYPQPVQHYCYWESGGTGD